MRKIVLSGVAAFGFLAIGLTVFGHAGSTRLADAEGSGVDVRMTRQTLVAMVEANRTDRPLLVAINLFPPSDSGTG